MLAELIASSLDWTGVPTTLLCMAIWLLFLCIRRKQRNELDAALYQKGLKQSHVQPMPSPPMLPIIGHIHLLRHHQRNPWNGFEEIRKEFGNVVSLKMGIHPMALVSSSEAMKEILLKKGDIFSNRPEFSRHHIVFGGDKENSLALCNWSNTHRDRRKLCKRGIAPNRFSSRNQLLEAIISKLVVNFIDDISRKQKHQVNHDHISRTSNSIGQPNDSLTGHPTQAIHNHRDASNQNPSMNNFSEKPHDQHQENLGNFYFKTTKEDILFLTSDVFMDFLCGEKYSHLDPKYKEFVHGCDFVFWDINQSYLIDFLPFLTSLGLGFSYLKKLKRVTDFLRDYIDDKIFEPRRIKHLELMKKEGKETEEQPSRTTNDDFKEFTSPQGGEPKQEDYLDTIIWEHLAQETSMSLADYKVGFADLLAGHAAVANILMRLLGHLALDLKIQDLICEEANKANIHKIDYRPSLPITEAALQEALRVASSPIVPHVAREDTSIDRFFVPKGTMVLFNNYHLNLSETLWTDPYKFDPFRFLVENVDAYGQSSYKIHIPKHFMPFSVGMRQCLGYKMVETTTILTVANICRRFVIKANDEDLVRQLVAPVGSVALNPDAKCFQLKLHPR